jgi:hypothetical protein
MFGQKRNIFLILALLIVSLNSLRFQYHEKDGTSHNAVPKMFKAVDPKSAAFKAEAKVELAKLNDEIINPPEEKNGTEEKAKINSNESQKNEKEGTISRKNDKIDLTKKEGK